MAPGSQAPAESVTLQGFLHHPEWHQRAACGGVGTDAFAIQRGSEYSRVLLGAMPSA